MYGGLHELDIGRYAVEHVDTRLLAIYIYLFSTLDWKRWQAIELLRRGGPQIGRA